METSRVKALYTTLSEHRQSHFLRDMTPTLAVWFGAWLIPALSGLLVVRSIWQFLLFLGIGYLGARRYRWGPGIYYPRDWWRGWQIKRQKGIVFSSEDADDAPGKKRLRLRHGQQAITLEPTDFLGVLASLYDPESRIDTVYVRVRGWSHVNNDVFGRHAADLRVVSVLKNVIAQLAGDIGICHLTCPRPFDPKEIYEDLRDNLLRPEVVNATEGDGVDFELQRHTNALLMNSTRRGREYFGLYALSVRRPAGWQAFARDPEKFSRDDLLNSPLKYVLDTLVDGLRSEGFYGVSIFDREELYDFIFRTWNVKYMEAVLAGKDARRKPGANPWPERQIVIDGPRQLVIIDGNYHRVLVTTRYGIQRVIAGGFYELMTGNKPWVTMAAPVVTVSKGMEFWLLKQKRDLTVAYQKERYKGGMIQDRESRDRRQATVDRVDAIYTSGSKPTRSNRYFVVSGSSLKQLEEAQRHLEAKLRRRQIRVVPVRGRARILRAFLAAMLGRSL